jgi:protein involved in polysaccharide export with SLBB domain
LRDSIKIPIISNKLLFFNNYIPGSDLELKSGDIINVPEIDNSVSVNGAVQQETIIVFEKSLSFKDVISSAGGFDEDANAKKSYILYQNGLKKTIKSYLFFKIYPKVLPGSKIVVPVKIVNRNKTSVAEIVGYTTSLVSIIALIKAF